MQAYVDVWRAGANFNTTFEVTDPVTIEGKPLARGTNGLHFIPGETSWIVIFSKNATSWGSFTYDQAEDALRINVKPKTIAHQEVLSYDFDNPTPSATLTGTAGTVTDTCRERAVAPSPPRVMFTS